MERNGFKNLYLSSEIRGLYVYTGEKKELKNYYAQIKKDLLYYVTSNMYGQPLLHA